MTVDVTLLAFLWLRDRFVLSIPHPFLSYLKFLPLPLHSPEFLSLKVTFPSSTSSTLFSLKVEFMPYCEKTLTDQKLGEDPEMLMALKKKKKDEPRRTL